MFLFNEDDVNQLRTNLPDWRFSLYEVLTHKEGVSTRTGEFEFVLGRSKPDYAVSAKSTDLGEAFRTVFAKAQALEDKRNVNAVPI